MAGIVGYGVYVPQYRLKQADAAVPWGGFGVGEKAVCGWDEDIISMAAEAMQNALQSAGMKGSDIDALFLGTASTPYLEQQISPILAQTLGTAPQAPLIDFTGTLNSVSNALTSALDALAAKRFKNVMVVGTENRAVGPGTEGEINFGCAAAAFVIGNKDTVADIEGFDTYQTLFFDRWRSVRDSWVSNYFDYRFAREFGYQKHISEAAKALMTKLEKKPDDFTNAIFYQADGRVPPLVAKQLGMKPDKLFPDLTPALGDLGSCSSYVCLTGLLENAKPGQRVLLGTYGSGSATAFSILVNDNIAAKQGRAKNLQKYVAKKSYVDYPTYLRLAGILTRAPY